MRTPIVRAELHAPLFLAGTNLGQKLGPDTKGKGQVNMEYDEKQRHLYIEYNGKSARIPETSVLSMEEGVVPPTMAEKVKAVQQPGNAQVSTPQSHVHAGPGHGDTGQAKVK